MSPIQVSELLSAEECAEIRASLARSLFHDGKLRAGQFASGVKRSSYAEPSAFEGAGARLVAKVFESTMLGSRLLPHRIGQPIFCRYETGDMYGLHEDNPIQGGLRADIAYTVFLSGPEEYSGGALALGEEPAIEYRPPLGSAVFYECGTPHQVRAVTRGIRFVAVGWLQSFVAGREQRDILWRLASLRADLWETSGPDGRQFVSVNRLYNDLVRLWCSV